MELGDCATSAMAAASIARAAVPPGADEAAPPCCADAASGTVSLASTVTDPALTTSERKHAGSMQPSEERKLALRVDRSALPKEATSPAMESGRLITVAATSTIASPEASGAKGGYDGGGGAGGGALRAPQP